MLLLILFINIFGYFTFAESYIEGEVLVQYKKDNIQGFIPFNKKVDTTILKNFSVQSVDEDTAIIHLIQTQTGESIEDMINFFSTQDNVEYVQPNYTYKIFGNPYIPNDPQYISGGLWGLNNIQRGETLGYFSGNNTVTTGSIVAVIDLGVDYRNPDISGQMRNGLDCKTYTGANRGNCNSGASFYRKNSITIENKDPLPESISHTGLYIEDINQHGTHIAGTIAATMNNGMGIVGVNPYAKIMAIKAGYQDYGNAYLTTDQIIKSINFAQHNGAHIINASFGIVGHTDPLMINAINSFTSQGGIFITAAGNDGINASTTFPCNLNPTNPGIICVGAHYPNNTLTSFSNYGPLVNISAPGANIISTFSSGMLATMDGTSMATPHVVGAFSLLWNYRPDLSAQDIKNVLYNGNSTLVGGQSIENNRRLNLFNSFKLLDNISPIIDDIIIDTNNYCINGEIGYEVLAHDDITLHEYAYSFDSENSWQISHMFTGGTILTVSIRDHNENITTTGITANIPNCTSTPQFPLFTNTTGLTLSVPYHPHYYYEFSGDIITYTTGSQSLSNTIEITLTEGEGEKYISWIRGNITGEEEILSGSALLLLDTTHPTITLTLYTGLEYTYEESIILSGIGFDNFGIQNIIINNNSVPFTDNNEGGVDRHTGIHLVPGNNSISMTITDDANNSTTITKQVYRIVNTPTNFSFNSQTNAELNTSVSSNLVTISGINTGIHISITGGEYRINGGGYISTPQIIYNGTTLQLRLTTSNNYNTTKQAKLTIGSGEKLFTVTTKQSSPIGGGSGGDGNNNNSGNSTTTEVTKTAPIHINDQIDNKPTIFQRQKDKYGLEMTQAYLYAYEYGITTVNDMEKANLHGALTRAQMSKMLSNYAINIIGKKPDTSKNCNFNDSKGYGDLSDWMKVSCQLGIMGVGIRDFKPNDIVTRAQFGTALSRVLWGDTYNTDGKYYEKHLKKLQQSEIMTKISEPFNHELRGYVMLMIMRAN